MTLLYIGIRTVQHRFLVQIVLASISKAETCQIIPTFHWFHWRFVAETKNCFYTGKIIYSRLLVEEVYLKNTRTIQENRIVRTTLKTEGVRTFLEFARYIHVTWKERQNGYEVQWSDVRFWYNSEASFWR